MYRQGVNEIFVLSRHLRLEGLENGNAESVVSAVDHMAGVNGVSINQKQGVLDLSYDASQLSIEQIEKVIKGTGNDFGHDWWTRLKKSWYRFTDSNTRSNARHKPGCCSKPPEA